MAEREAALAEQTLGVGPRHPGVQFCFPRHLVEPPQLIQPAQVQRHHRLESPARRVEPADHGGAAAERHHGDAVVGTEPQHLGDLVVATGQQYRVGSVLDAEIAAAQQVQRRLAAGAQQPVVVGDGDVGVTEDRGEAVPVGSRQRRRSQTHFLEARRSHVGGFEAERLLEQRPDAR